MNFHLLGALPSLILDVGLVVGLVWVARRVVHRHN